MIRKLVAIRGCRDYEIPDSGFLWLASLLNWRSDGYAVVNGGCKTGVDAVTRGWAMGMGVWGKKVEADWDKYGKAAGPIRNGWLVDMADIAVVFPGGRGTADFCRRAEGKTGMRVFKFKEHF